MMQVIAGVVTEQTLVMVVSFVSFVLFIIREHSSEQCHIYECSVRVRFRWRTCWDLSVES